MSPTENPQTMMALRAHERGGPEVLVYESAPKPTQAPGHALIAVEAASITFTELNWDETWARDGVSRLPTIPSHEFAGVIESVDPNPQGLAAGDHVFGLIPFDVDGAAAEYVSAETSILSRAPQSVGAAEAAATPLAALTAWQGLLDRASLQAGQHVLIHGGGGGVGIFAVQLAHHFGARVTTTARGADVELLRSLGAADVIDFETTHFEDADRKYDIVIDPIGGETLDRSFGVVRPGGTLVTLNAPPPAGRAEEFGINALFFIVGPNSDELSAIAQLIDSGDLTPIVAATFPLSDGRKAFESGALHGRPPGKTVLVV